MKSINFCAIFVTLIVVFSFACARQSQLPKEVPENLEIKFETNLLRESLVRRAVISGNQLTYERARCEGVLNKTVSTDEIKRIYETFVKGEFDLIQSLDNKEANEFKQISLKAGTISKVIKYGNNSRFSKTDDESLGNIRTEIADLLEDHVEHCRN